MVAKMPPSRLLTRVKRKNPSKKFLGLIRLNSTVASRLGGAAVFFNAMPDIPVIHRVV